MSPYLVDVHQQAMIKITNDQWKKRIGKSQILRVSFWLRDVMVVSLLESELSEEQAIKAKFTNYLRSRHHISMHGRKFIPQFVAIKDVANCRASILPRDIMSHSHIRKSVLVSAPF